MKKKGPTGFLRYREYLIAGTLVIIAAIGATTIYSRNQEDERARMEAELAQEMSETAEQQNAEAAGNAAENVAERPSEEREIPSAEASVIVLPEQESTEQAVVAEEEKETEEEADAEASSSSAKTLHFDAENGILWPMEGNVILNYSMDSTVYFATLDQYKYNPAVIIAGDVNSKVYSVAPGQIQSIETNEVTGCTVTVDLGDGYQAVYGQLKELNFGEGDYVEAGHVIGYVSEPTKYFSVEGSNLYFQLLKDGVPVDPIEYFE